MCASEDFPTVDISVFRRAPFPGDSSFPSTEQQLVAKTIDSALRQNGFFILRNFGIEEGLLKKLFSDSAQLFAPSLEEKKRTLFPMSRSTGSFGYILPGAEKLNASRGTSAESKEAFHLRMCDSIDQNLTGCSPGFQFSARKFGSSILDESLPQITIALSVALGVPYEYLNEFHQGNNTMFRFLHYPPMPASPATIIRAGEHTDFGTITLLFTDSPGLQVQPVSGGELLNGNLKNVSKNWINVPVPKFGDAIVNVGAIMARLTNDRWPAALHRVVDKSLENDRYSIACFIQPMEDISLKIHPKFIKDNNIENKTYMEEITAGEYIQRRCNEIDVKRS